MFKNFKVIAHLGSPLCAIDDIILDSVISAAMYKDLLKDDYYFGSNKYGTKEQIDSMLSAILDKQYGVYCTSYGFGNDRETISSWSKRFDVKNDDLIKFTGKAKHRVDLGAGYFQNYHIPIVLKSVKTLTFYVRGDMERIKYLLENYIFYLGKKPSQGYGEIRYWEFEEIKDNISVLNKENKNMRNIPFNEISDILEQNASTSKNKSEDFTFNLKKMPVIPPYWRPDCKKVCVV